MAPFIHSKREGTHIIDLTKTVAALEEVLPLITKAVADGHQVLFVGTKRQAKDIVKAAAVEVGMPYVTERWLGGMLTNQATIGGRIKYLRDLEVQMDSGAIANKYNKLEQQRIQEEIDQMNHLYGGIKDLAARPGFVFITDILSDANAVREANKLGLKTVAIVDTNADPTDITYPIPANDDAIKTIQLIVDYVKAAVVAGKAKRKVSKDDKTEDEEK
jgi:small subunit ribosomal protein S2